jgi:transglutaminase-like putative cysteine protease
MRFRLRHQTRYLYDLEVSVALHVARLRPRETPTQQCMCHRLEITPAPASTQERVDYFGNTATFLTMEGKHREFAVTAFSEVEVRPPVHPPLDQTPPWDEVRALCAGSLYNHDTAAAEFAYDSEHVRRSPDFASYARPSFPAGRPLLEAVSDLNRRIHRDFAFDNEATSVATPVEEVLRLRAGVCQDFAHLGIACLRSMGIPARYVSGYIETLPPPGQPKLVGADASHAWFSVWCPGVGWVDFDPTNRLMPTDRHIVVGWGMDFSDVSPVRGILLAQGAHTLEVSVDVELWDDAEGVLPKTSEKS